MNSITELFHKRNEFSKDGGKLLKTKQKCLRNIDVAQLCILDDDSVDKDGKGVIQFIDKLNRIRQGIFPIISFVQAFAIQVCKSHGHDFIFSVIDKKTNGMAFDALEVFQ